MTESVTDSMTALAPAVGVATESVTESEVVHFPVTEFRDGLGDSARGRDIVATDSVTAS